MLQGVSTRVRWIGIMGEAAGAGAISGAAATGGPGSNAANQSSRSSCSCSLMSGSAYAPCPRPRKVGIERGPAHAQALGDLRHRDAGVLEKSPRHREILVRELAP